MLRRFGLGLMAAISISGCTRPNPQSCADGICSDQQYPFCDVDGTLGGEPNECIAISCTPGEHVACRGSEAIRCNATGNNYDVIQCELGCDPASGCFSCSTNDECSNPSPVCDLGTHACRECRDDDECASRVCDVDTGTCLAESEVTYATSPGTNSGPCSLTAPCTIARATELAFANPLRSTVRLLPSDYLNEWLLLQTEGKVSIVGTGATVRGFFMERGDVSIRGIRFKMDAADSTAWNVAGREMPSRLQLRDSVLELRGKIDVFHTVTKFSRVEVRWSSLQPELVVQRLARFEVEQSRFTSVNGLGYVRLAGGENKSIRFVNSIFDNFAFFFESADGVGSVSTFELAFNTIFAPRFAEPVVTCDGAGKWTALLENNIIYSGSGNTVLPGTKCTFNRNVVFPQSVAFDGTNIFLNPLFVDLANHDLHISSGSPAIDAAVPSAGLDPDADLEGTPRPQGASKDIGAYERQP